MSVLALGGSLEWPLEELQRLALPRWLDLSALQSARDDSVIIIYVYVLSATFVAVIILLKLIAKESNGKAHQ